MTTTSAEPVEHGAVDNRRFDGATIDRLGIFALLWAGQGLVQIATYVDFERDVTWWALALATVSVVVRPRSTALLVCMLILNIAYSWLHLPYVVNHLLFEDAVNLMILGALALMWRRHRGAPAVTIRGLAARAFAGPVRAALIFLYGWAGFSKLNSDYFSPAVSCASQMLADALHTDVSGSLLSSMSISTAVVSAGMELGLALLLAFRRTRLVAIPLGLAFHLGLAVVPYAAVQAFSYLVFATYFVFTDDEFHRALVRLAEDVVDLTRNSWRLALKAAAILILGTAVGLAGYAARWGVADAFEAAYNSGLFVGLVVAFGAFAVCARRVGLRHVASPDRYLVGSPVLWSVAVLVLVLGALPYGGFGTRASFSMFSNLRTEDGRSNHLIVPDELQVAGYQLDLVRIVTTDEPTLQTHLDAGNLLTRFELERILFESNDFTVVCECYGATRQITKQGGRLEGFDHPKVYSPALGKLISFRPVSPGPRMSCLH